MVYSSNVTNGVSSSVMYWYSCQNTRISKTSMFTSRPKKEKKKKKRKEKGMFTMIHKSVIESATNGEWWVENCASGYKVVV